MMLAIEKPQLITPRGRTRGRDRVRAFSGVLPWKAQVLATRKGGRTPRASRLRGELSLDSDVFLRLQKQPDGE